MTWEQFVSAVLAIGVTALVRFVNMKLPPVLDHHGASTGTEPNPVPPPAAQMPDPDSEPTTGAPPLSEDPL